MNRKTAQILTLAALSSFSAASMAFSTRVAPKTETTIALPAPKLNVDVKTPVTTEIKVGNTLNLKSDIVMKHAEKSKSKGFQCDSSLFDRFVEGTTLNAAAIRDAQARGVINVDNVGCEPNNPEAVVNYEAPAKQIAGETVLCELENGIEAVSDMGARAQIGGTCLMKAKANHGEKNTVLATEVGKWNKIHEHCNIVL